MSYIPEVGAESPLEDEITVGKLEAELFRATDEVETVDKEVLEDAVAVEVVLEVESPKAAEIEESVDDTSGLLMTEVEEAVCVKEKCPGPS